MRKITFLLFTIFAFCWQSNAQFTEGFDTEIPASWTILNEDGGTYTWTHQTQYPYAGAGHARIHWESAAHNDFLITPQFAVTSNISDRISFYAGIDGTFYTETFDVRVSTTGVLAADFTTIASETATTDADGNYTQYTYDLSSYNGQSIYVAIVATDTDRFYFYIDEFVNDGLPDCEQAEIASSTVIEDCDNLEYSIDVDVSSVGDATEITDGTDTWPITGVGIVTVGPFASGTSVDLSVTHSDAACNLSLGNFLFNCPPDNTSCATATMINCGDPTINGSTTGSTGTSEGIGCSLGNNGVWYTFTGTGGDITVASTASFDHEMAIARGECGVLTNVSCNDDALSNEEESYTIPLSILNETYYVYIAQYAGSSTTTGTYSITLTCATPPSCTQAQVASSTIVEDCNASEFSVDVDVTTVADAVEISNGTDTWAITGAGIVTVGPFAFGESQTLTVVHSNSDCDLDLGSFNFTSCPPANDACDSATVISGLPFVVSENALGATNNDGFITDCAFGMNDGVWYSFTPTSDGTVNIEITNSIGSDLELAIYSGSCGTFTCVDSVDSNGSGADESLMAVDVVTGTQYFINVGHYSGSTNNSEGTFDISISGTVTLSTDSLDAENTFTYFPNPVKGTLNLKAQNNIQNVSVYNMLGQEVLRNRPNTLESNVDMSSLQTGTYFVKVTIQDRTQTVKVLKN